MKPGTTLAELRARGLIEQVSNEPAVEKLLDTPGTSIYVGFDPTADSLHVGHMLPAVLQARLQRRGLRPIMVAGGATGMIGDPSGKTSERQLLTPDEIAANLESIKKQLARFVSLQGANAALIVNNADWIGPISHVDWLRDVGKYFTVNYMLAKESVRSRLEDREHGISYTEFSYMLLQAYDFLHLFDKQNCVMQAGGSDQWGNITAGIELIRKVRGKEAFGFTLPLLSTASGQKFGKSEGNAVWLDPKRTSPYQFYQFWIQTDDRDVERYLKLFTFESLESIEGIARNHSQQPERREAQRLLAARMTEMVHGAAGLKEAERASDVLFGKEFSGLSDEELSAIFADVPSVSVPAAQLNSGMRLSQLLVSARACASRGEANRLLQSGGVYLNNRRVQEDRPISRQDLASTNLLVLRTGKKSYFLVRFS